MSNRLTEDDLNEAQEAFNYMSDCIFQTLRELRDEIRLSNERNEVLQKTVERLLRDRAEREGITHYSGCVYD